MRKKKIKNIIISGLLILMITVNSYYYTYASSLAATVALGDALTTAGAGGTVGCLLAPEVIIPMALVALGVAGIGFVAHSGIVQDIAQDLRDNHSEWTVLQGGNNGDDPNNRRPFLKGWYRAGKVFISEGLLFLIARYAVDHGLFNGVETELEIPTFQSDFETQTLEINNTASVTEIIAHAAKYYQYSNPQFSSMIYELFSAIYQNSDGYNALYSRNIWMASGSSGGSLSLYGIEGNIPYVNTFVYDSGNAIRTQSNTQGCRIIRYSDGQLYIFNGTLDYMRVGANFFNDTFMISGLGINAGAITGIPVTDNIPEIDNDEVILPQWDYDSIKVPKVLPDGLPDPAALEDALPVSVPDGYEIPMIYPNEWPDALPELQPAPQPYPWPNNLPHNPANPDPDAQPEAQEGGGADIPTIDNPNGDATFNSFLVPENIKEKYPFCIPFDMYDIYHILFYGSNPDSAHKKTNQLISANSIQAVNMSRAAPHYEIDYSSIRGFENAAPIVIDLSRFDDTAELFRLAVLTLWGADLIFSGFSAASGGKN